MTAVGFDARTILGFDPFDPTFLADPYAHYRRLREGGALQRTAAGLWVSPSYEVCVQVLRSPRFGNGAAPTIGGAGGDAAQASPRRAFLFLDPPDHTRLRGLVSKAFSARMIERLRPGVEQLVDRLLTDAFGPPTGSAAGADAQAGTSARAGTGTRAETNAQAGADTRAETNAAAGDAGGEPVDLISALAYPLPITVISELLGVPPQDRTRFQAWSQALARGLDPDFLLPPDELDRQQRARLEFAGYFRDLVARRRAEPRDDLLSALVLVEESGDTLSEEELLATCVLLLVAGHETTVNLIGNGTLALLRAPDTYAWLREHPGSAGGLVDELLRYDPPVQLSARMALTDTDIEVPGAAEPVRIAAGEMILLLLGAANRDPAVFAEPDRLDPLRAGRHLSFGHGIHFCLGASLARLEGEVALAALARRVPGLTLATDRPAYKDNLILRGLATLPVWPG